MSISKVIGFSENLRMEIAVPRKRQRRNDDVHTRAVFQAGVSQRRGLVNTAANLVHDTLSDLEKVLFIAEPDRRDDELTLLSRCRSDPGR